MSSITNTKGTLLQKFGEVTGVTDPSSTEVRKGYEWRIMTNPHLKSSLPELQSHSARVGQKYYDKSSQNRKAYYVQSICNVESPLKNSQNIPDHIAKKRRTREESDRRRVADEAKKYLETDKMRKNIRLSKRCKLLPDDHLFVQELLSVKLKHSEDIPPLLPGIKI